MPKIIHGDCLEELKKMPDNSVDSGLMDPPYGLSEQPDMWEILSHWMKGEYRTEKTKGFMGKEWDGFVPAPDIWKELYRVLKPGAFCLVFAGSRTQDLMALSMRLGGFHIRDTIMWIYGSGFPKSANIAKHIDKKLGYKGKIVGTQKQQGAKFKTVQKTIDNGGFNDPDREEFEIIEVESEKAKMWDGWGSALKPSYEPIIIGWKPNDGSFADNALKWGVSGINIDGCRIETNEDTSRILGPSLGWKNTSGLTGSVSDDWKKGRWPANIIIDDSDEVQRLFPDVHGAGYKKPPGNFSRSPNKSIFDNSKGGIGQDSFGGARFGDNGSAARFFYCAKASKQERELGLDNFEKQDSLKWVGGSVATTYPDGSPRPEQTSKNNHPTVKPIALMKYLATMLKMPEPTTVIDCFGGSGTTALGCIEARLDYIIIEKDDDYFEIMKARIENYEPGMLEYSSKPKEKTSNKTTKSSLF